MLVYLVCPNGLPFLAMLAYVLYLDMGFKTRNSLVIDEDTALKNLDFVGFYTESSSTVICIQQQSPTYT